jgi:pilus assembly protein CpaB
MNRRFLLVAILLAGLSAALVYAKISAKSETSTVSVGTGEQQVVVAKSAIKQRTTITAEMLELKSVPLTAVTSGAFTQISDVTGKVTKYPVEPNQQVVGTSVVDTERPVADAALALVIPTGKRAMSIQASQVSNAGGLILPGDWVDVIWTCCSDRPVVVKTLFKNMQVAAVAQSIVSSGPVVAGKAPAAGDGSNPVAADSGKPTPDAQTITLLVTPLEAQQLYLAESTGKLRADLRGVGDTEMMDPGYTLATDILPVEALQKLPDVLKPEGYKP